MRTAIVLVLVALSAGCSSSDGSGGTSTSETTDGGGGTKPPTGSGADGGGGTTTPPGNTDPDAGAGGGGDTDASVPPTGGDVATACAELASAICGRLSTCSPFGLAVTYGDAATCKTRVALGCVAGLAAPGTSSTAEGSAACAKALPGIACGDFLSQKLTGACAILPGTLDAGKPCLEDAQCKSTFCARDPNATCGTCAAPTTAGAACVNGACSAPTVCPAKETKCVTPVAGQVNDACARQEDCDTAHAVGCNTFTKKCIALATASSGGACGNLSGGKPFTVCTAGGACSGTIGAGTCAPAAADGASCSTADTGPHCLLPAKCVGGKCTLPDAAACK